MNSYEKAQPSTALMEAGKGGTSKVAPHVACATHTCKDPLLPRQGCDTLQRSPDSSALPGLCGTSVLWLLFSNYIKPVLLKSVPSRDNALDAFN